MLTWRVVRCRGGSGVSRSCERTAALVGFRGSGEVPPKVGCVYVHVLFFL